jgi:hypothetical protein
VPRANRFGVIQSAIIILLMTGLAGCLRTNSPTAAAGGFMPPTVEPSLTPLPATAAPLPTKVAECTDTLSYMEDITIPDGTEVKPGDKLDKRWQIRNNGTCDWDGTYTLKLIAGTGMGGPEVQALYPARAGSAAVIRVELTAPTETGTYRSAWQAYNGSDEPFGDPIYIEVVVKDK